MPAGCRPKAKDLEPCAVVGDYGLLGDRGLVAIDQRRAFAAVSFERCGPEELFDDLVDGGGVLRVDHVVIDADRRAAAQTGIGHCRAVPRFIDDPLVGDLAACPVLIETALAGDRDGLIAIH